MKCKHTMIPQSSTRTTVRTSGECVSVISPSWSLPACVWSSGCLDSVASKTTALPALATAGPSLGRTILGNQDNTRPQGTRDEAREVFQQGHRVHQRSRRPIGVWVGETHRGRRWDRSRRVLRRRWGRCRPRGPRHLVLPLNKYFVPTSAHEVLGTKTTSDRMRPLHNTNSRHF